MRSSHATPAPGRPRRRPSSTRSETPSPRSSHACHQTPRATPRVQGCAEDESVIRAELRGRHPRPTARTAAPRPLRADRRAETRAGRSDGAIAGACSMSIRANSSKLAAVPEYHSPRAGRAAARTSAPQRQPQHLLLFPSRARATSQRLRSNPVSHGVFHRPTHSGNTRTVSECTWRSKNRHLPQCERERPLTNGVTSTYPFGGYRGHLSA